MERKFQDKQETKLISKHDTENETHGKHMLDLFVSHRSKNLHDKEPQKYYYKVPPPTSQKKSENTLFFERRNTYKQRYFMMGTLAARFIKKGILWVPI